MHCLAIDIGASSGRHIVGWLEDGTIKTKEVYRFPNGVAERDGHLTWDMDALLGHVREGIDKALEEFGALDSFSIDTWGCDYVLLRGEEEVSTPVRFCSFSPNRQCRKMAGKRVQPLNNYTCRFRPSSLKQADKSGLDWLQAGKAMQAAPRPRLLMSMAGSIRDSPAGVSRAANTTGMNAQCIPVMAMKGGHEWWKYVYDEYYDCVICPEYQPLAYRTTNRDGYREYRSGPKICAQCPTRQLCTRSKSCVKTVLRHVWKDYEELADNARYTPQYKDLYAKRKETISFTLPRTAAVRAPGPVPRCRWWCSPG